jgi:glutamine synthetase
VKEAAKRGLSNIKTAPDALDAVASNKAVQLFTAHGVMSEREIHARHEIQLEAYSKKIQIESRLIGDLAFNHIIPAAIRYQNILIQNAQGLKMLFGEAEFKKQAAGQLEIIREISGHINVIRKEVEGMTEERKKSNAIEDVKKNAQAYCNRVKPYFDVIRYHVDKLELLVDNEFWPLPKYRELLWMR